MTTVIYNDLYKPLKPLFKHSGPQLHCSDSELITFAIVGECKGRDQETELISEWQNYRHLFPNLPERSRFNRRRRNLMGAINAIRQSYSLILDLAQDQQGAIDSLLLLIIEFKKAYYSPFRNYWKSYRARYGKVRSKKITIFHFRQIVETVNGQLATQFNLEINRAHSFGGLCARLNTKLAGHTLSIYLNSLLGNKDFLNLKALAFPIYHNTLTSTIPYKNVIPATFTQGQIRKDLWFWLVLARSSR